jgi:hypothetical protein
LEKKKKKIEENSFNSQCEDNNNIKMKKKNISKIIKIPTNNDEYDNDNQINIDIDDVSNQNEI